MKRHGSTVLLVLVLLVGVSLLLYPTVSDYYNSFHQTRAIAGYAQAVQQTSSVDYSAWWDAAIAYNATLPDRPERLRPTEEETAEYNALLDVNGNGVMGIIEIEKIGVSLPIYHGTGEAVLQVAVGHIEGTSLPTGGPGTHCAVSGHRGLPSAKLFTHLDQLAVGDLFVIRVLNEVMTYEVDQIRIVEPYDVSDLEILPEEDLCTLVTCTPYGINSHRLLVRGHRTENVAAQAAIRVAADAVQIEPMLVAPVVAAPMLMILLVILLISTGRHGNNKRKER